MNTRRVWTAIFLVGLLGGCGSKNGSEGPHAEVNGTVLLDGTALPDAEVQFVPNGDPSLGLHVGKTDSAGRFTIAQDASNNPVRPGSYVVLVSKVTGGNDPSLPGGGMEAQKNAVPAIYQDRQKSPLKAEVQVGINNLEPFRIEKADSRSK